MDLRWNLSACILCQDGGRSCWLPTVPHPSQPGAAPALREASRSARCGGHRSQEPPCPEAGRRPLARPLSLTCHPHAQPQPGRSPRFSWRLLGEGLSRGNERFANETFSSLAGGYTPASPTSQEASPARWLLVLLSCPPPSAGVRFRLVEEEELGCLILAV